MPLDSGPVSAPWRASVVASPGPRRQSWRMGSRWLRFALPLFGLAVLVVGLAGCVGGRSPIAVLATAVVTGPAPLDVAFDLSHTVHPLGRPITFELDFGDGSAPLVGSDVGIIAHHTYSLGGTYEAVLSVTDEDGAAGTDRVQITVDDVGPPVGIQVGETAPDFTAHTTDGGTFTLSTLRGSVVLLDFWGAWCPPCRSTLPHLDSLVRAYASRGLVAVIVGTDINEADAVDYLAQQELTRFTSVWEPGGKSGNPIAQLYGVSSGDVGIPRTYVIDRQGVIRFVGHPSSLTSDMIETIL